VRAHLLPQIAYEPVYRDFIGGWGAYYMLVILMRLMATSLVSCLYTSVLEVYCTTRTCNSNWDVL
jgi:hypothetical protein